MSDEKNEDKPKDLKEGNIDVKDLPYVECRCGNYIWEYGFVLKRLDTKQTGKKNIPIDVIQCKKCGCILQDGVPMLKQPT